MGAETVRQLPLRRRRRLGRGRRRLPRARPSACSTVAPVDDLPGVRTRANVGGGVCGRAIRRTRRPCTPWTSLPVARLLRLLRAVRARAASARDWRPASSSRRRAAAGGARGATARSAASTARRCAFRSKSARRALASSPRSPRATPAARAGDRQHPRHALPSRSFVPELAPARPRRCTLFYETKANLTKEQVRRLATRASRASSPASRASATRSSELMRKGVDARSRTSSS